MQLEEGDEPEKLRIGRELRLGLGHYNTLGEVDEALASIEHVLAGKSAA